MTKVHVNQAARCLGVSAAWLRRAERRARVPRAGRDLNGWRMYSQEDIATLRTVLSPRAPDEGRPGLGGGQDDEGARP